MKSKKKPIILPNTGKIELKSFCIKEQRKMKVYSKFFVFILMIMYGLGKPIFAEETKIDSLKNDKRYYELEGIRVIAESPKESIGSISNKIYTENTEEMNLANAIEDFTGSEITSGGKGGSSFSIRGFNEKQIKILLDGRPLGAGYFGDIDLNTIPLSEIKEIQVIKGPVSSVYGSNTMGGVVNIITKSSENQPFIKLGSTFKRNNTNKLYLSSSKHFSNWDYWVYASRYHTDGKVLSNDFQSTAYENGDVLNNSANEQIDLQAKLNCTVFDLHSIGFQAGYTTFEEKEIPSSIYEANFRKFLNWKRYQISGMGSFYFLPQVIGNYHIFYDAYDDTYAEFADESYETMFSQWPSYLESWTFGISQKYKWQANDLYTLQAGHRYEKQVYNRKDNGSYLYWTSNYKMLNQFFTQLEMNFGKFSSTAGSGLSMFRFKDHENWKLHWEPSIGLRYETTNQASIAASYAHNTNYPTLRHLYSSSSGNPDLKAETADKFEVEIRKPFVVGKRSGSFSVSGYYNKIENVIEKMFGMFQNIEKMNSYGWESELLFNWLWEQRISYSYFDYESNWIISAPKHKLQLAENFRLLKGCNLIIKSSWKYDRKEMLENGDIATLHAYWMHQFSISKKWDRFYLNVGIENIFDKNVMEEYGYPIEGRNFFIQIETWLN